jgi:hypothetical protein
MKRKGIVTKIIGNMVSVEVDGAVIQNEVAYILHGKEQLKSKLSVSAEKLPRCRCMKRQPRFA